MSEKVKGATYKEIMEAVFDSFASMKDDPSRCCACNERVQTNTDGEWIHARYPAEDGHEALPNAFAILKDQEWRMTHEA